VVLLGTVSDIDLDSQAVGRQMRLRIILPSLKQDMIYPLLLFLHPWGLSPQYITDKLHIHLHLWRGIEQGTLPPMIVLLPTGDKSFFLNAADPPGRDWSPIVSGGGEFFRNALSLYGQYGDYLFNEALPYVDTHYPTRKDRAGRAIGGISMGGAAAAVHGFSHPDQFYAVGIHSPAVFPGPPGQGGPPWIFGVDAASYAARNPADIVQHLNPANQPHIYLDCGDRDPLLMNVEQLHAVMQECQIQHEYRIEAGKHDKTYWEPRMSRYLAFYAQGWLNETR
jgi:enterochelin esterase-like enzyme